ncbi:DUF4179 domain-containing protein [Lysinibacillus sp. LZ02]|uniref:DUF4179 domain-containing protein n=1 Tax=Lysinibacillus sp. LZ02 TaxID=3420668 RepID=UPI003D36D43E
MKEIYKAFNDIELDQTEFIELEVHDIEKARVKKYLQQTMTKKKKRNGWLPRFAIASILFVIGGIGVGLAFPASAGSIPIVRDIFKFIDGDRSALYENYKEFSTEVLLTEKSKGIEITINDAIYDGETVFITYSIYSEKPLGEQPSFREMTSLKDADGHTSGMEVMKVDEHNYVGVLRVGSIGQNVGQTAHIVWAIDKILNPETEKVINGNWRFAFSVDATTQYTTSINQSVEQDGIKVTIEKITQTPMSVIVYARQQLEENVLQEWNSVNLDFTMTDNVGNFYEGVGNGGRGEIHDMMIGKTFEKLDEHATTITIAPQLHLVSYPQSSGEQMQGTDEFGDTSVSVTVNQSGGNSRDIKMEPIVIELKND